MSIVGILNSRERERMIGVVLEEVIQDFCCGVRQQLWGDILE